MLKSDLHDAVRITQQILDKTAGHIARSAILVRPVPSAPDTIALSSTNFQTEIEVRLPGTVDKAFAIDGFLLRRVLDAGGHPKENIRLVEDASKGSASLVRGKNTYSFPSANPADMAEFLADREKSPLRHTAKQNLLTLLEVSDFPCSATSTDPTRPNLELLWFTEEGQVMASDGHRLHIGRLPRPMAPFGFAIPRDTYDVLRKTQAILKSVWTQVEIRASAFDGTEPIENLVIFTTGNVTLSVTIACRVDLTTPMPAFDQVLWPLAHATTKHEVERLELEEAVELAKKCGFGKLTLDLTGTNKILLHATDPAAGDMTAEIATTGGEMPLSPDRDGILPEGHGRAGMTPAYLLAALAGMSGKVTIFGQGKYNPLIIMNAQNNASAVIMGHVLS